MERKLLKEILEKLKDLQGYGDTEISHSKADDLLCELLLQLGYRKIVEEYRKIEKWFA